MVKTKLYFQMSPNKKEMMECVTKAHSKSSLFFFYSVLNATTGSLRAAIPLGIKPAMSVNIVDNMMR